MSEIGNVVLMLVYEPASPESTPVPVLRVSDVGLAAAVAQAAVLEAEARAREISLLDEVLGKIEEIEALRLRRLLGLLIPEFASQSSRCASTFSVM